MSYSVIIKLSDRKEVEREIVSGKEASEIIQIEVLNGCGVSKIADRFTDYLRDRDFDVVNIGNYNSYDIDESLVIDRIGNLANARKVAETLGINKENVIRQLNDEYFLDVSLVIGKDYHKLNPLK